MADINQTILGIISDQNRPIQRIFYFDHLEVWGLSLVTFYLFHSSHWSIEILQWSTLALYSKVLCGLVWPGLLWNCSPVGSWDQGTFADASRMRSSVALQGHQPICVLNKVLVLKLTCRYADILWDFNAIIMVSILQTQSSVTHPGNRLFSWHC